MVKADMNRDYYADLELQAGASDSDVRKQFRKLALKYHPDRNPGREAEVNSKFQIINAAHEVLTDPEQRAKYDAGRVRAGGTRTYSGFNTSTSSGTRGNPWSSAGSQWAPPPKPPPAREFEKRKPPPASTGAQRYSQFTTPNGAAPKANQDAEARMKNYQAWEKMKPQPSRAYQPTTPKPVPKEFTPQSGREESNNFKHAPPPKSSRPGYDEFRAANSSDGPRTSPSRNKSSNEPPRRNGFMPATPGGDEPPASSTSAYSNYRSERPSMTRPSAAPEPPPRNAPPPDPLKQSRENTGTPFEPRLSTPYATHGGERTNPFESININRSKSTRQPSPRTNPVNAGFSSSRDRYRSASPPRSKHNRNLSPEPGIARADSEINLGTSPKRTFSTHAGRDARPSEHSRAQARYTPAVNTDTSSDGDDSDSEIHQQSFGRRSRTYAKRRTTQSSARTQEAQNPLGKPESSTAATDEQPRKPSLAEFRQWWSSSEEAKRNMLNNMQPDGPPNSHNNADRNSNNSKREQPSIFSFNLGDDTFRPSATSHEQFTSNSAENISTKFTPEDWHGKFEAGDYFTNGQSSKGSSRTRSGSRTRTRSPVKGRPKSKSQTNLRPSGPSIDPEILQETAGPEPSITSPGGTKFTAEEWKQTFKPETFAPPAFAAANTTSRPTRAPRRSRTGSSIKGPNVSKTAGSAALVSEDDNSDDLYMGPRAAEPTTTPGTTRNGPVGTDSPNAMDIDPPLESQPEPQQSHQEPGLPGFPQSENAAARNVPLEPSRPDWRAGEFSGAGAATPSLARLQPDLPPRKSTANRSERRTTKSADEEDLRTNFEDLKNVEPLHHPATGLQSFVDLTSNLPFPSRAASSLTIGRNFGTGKLDLPNPPRAPMVPPLSTGAIRPAQSSWESYLTAFKAYIAEWDIFNTKMILHFVGRKNQVDSMKPGWLEAFGDMDLDKYKEGLKEDCIVREHWAVACEKHQFAMDKFQAYKSVVRGGIK